MHLCDVVDVVVVVVSHPLHVLSQSPGTLAHNPCAKMIWHLESDSLLRLFAQRCKVEVFDWAVVVVSHPLQVLPHSRTNFAHRPPSNNTWH